MATKGRLKTCKKGHQFYKSSDCPTCPICEEERKPKDSFLALIGAPARRALERENIMTLEDLAKWSEGEIIKLHGMGPSTISKLKKALIDNGLSFKTLMLDSEVTNFLDNLNHPFRKEIEQLRNHILSAHTALTENIKWNGPNYCFDSEDRITVKIQPPTKQVQLIFHRGAKKQAQPKDKLIACKSKLLVWKENDRAIITFKTCKTSKMEKLN